MSPVSCRVDLPHANHTFYFEFRSRCEVDETKRIHGPPRVQVEGHETGSFKVDSFPSGSPQLELSGPRTVNSDSETAQVHWYRIPVQICLVPFDGVGGAWSADDGCQVIKRAVTRRPR